MPSIREVVQALGQREGVDAVLVLGRDGLPIDSTGKDVLDIENVAALIPGVVTAGQHLSQSSSRGNFQTSVVESDNGYFIVDALSADVLLAIFIQPETNLGSILYELRRYRTAIAGLL